MPSRSIFDKPRLKPYCLQTLLFGNRLNQSIRATLINPMSVQLSSYCYFDELFNERR